MRSLQYFILLILICGVLAVAGCTTNTAPAVPATHTSSVPLASLAIDRNDLPEYYILTASYDKNITEMGELAQHLGWQAGHVTEYMTTKDVPEGFQTVVRQTLATYPESSMPEIIRYIVQSDQSYSNLVYTDFPAPGLGGNGIVFVANNRMLADATPVPTVTGALAASDALKEQTFERPDGQIFAEAIFAKGTTLEVIRMTGPAPDPQNLTVIAQKAYSKIP